MTAAASSDRSASAPSSSSKPPTPRPSRSASARLEADEPLHGQPAGPPGVVEPLLERLAPARAQARREPRPEPRREALDQPRAAAERPALAVIAADAPAEPLDRPVVAQHRDRQQRRRRGRTRSSAPASSGIRRPPSSCARISTNAIAHSIPVDDERGEAEQRRRSSPSSRPGEMTLTSRIVAPPMPATT